MGGRLSFRTGGGGDRKLHRASILRLSGGREGPQHRTPPIPMEGLLHRPPTFSLPTTYSQSCLGGPWVSVQHCHLPQCPLGPRCWTALFPLLLGCGHGSGAPVTVSLAHTQPMSPQRIPGPSSSQGRCPAGQVTATSLFSCRAWGSVSSVQGQECTGPLVGSMSCSSWQGRWALLPGGAGLTLVVEEQEHSLSLLDIPLISQPVT